MGIYDPYDMEKKAIESREKCWDEALIIFGSIAIITLIITLSVIVSPLFLFSFLLSIPTILIVRKRNKPTLVTKNDPDYIEAMKEVDDFLNYKELEDKNETFIPDPRKSFYRCDPGPAKENQELEFVGTTSFNSEYIVRASLDSPYINVHKFSDDEFRLISQIKIITNRLEECLNEE